MKTLEEFQKEDEKNRKKVLKKYPEKLKPCPFCGGKARIVVDDDFVYIQCKKCEVNTRYEDWEDIYADGPGVVISEGPGVLIKEWNTRKEK
jgi:transcription elongation factor Elf1